MKILIAELRKQRGITQEDLAKKVDISRPYLAQIEGGKRNLSLHNQKLIADALGVSAKSIVDFDANNGDESLILEAFGTLSSEQRGIWLELARAILRSDQNQSRDQ